MFNNLWPQLLIAVSLVSDQYECKKREKRECKKGKGKGNLLK